MLRRLMPQRLVRAFASRPIVKWLAWNPSGSTNHPEIRANYGPTRLKNPPIIGSVERAVAAVLLGERAGSIRKFVRTAGLRTKSSQLGA